MSGIKRGARQPRWLTSTRYTHNVMTQLRYDLQYGTLDLVDDALIIAGILESIAEPPGRRSQSRNRARWALDVTSAPTARFFSEESRDQKNTGTSVSRESVRVDVLDERGHSRCV